MARLDPSYRRPGPLLAALFASVSAHLAFLALVGLDSSPPPPDHSPPSHQVRFLSEPQESSEPDPYAPKAAADSEASGRSRGERSERKPPSEPGDSSPSSGEEKAPDSQSTPEAETAAAEVPSPLTAPEAQRPAPSRSSRATGEGPPGSLALFPSARETARLQTPPEQARADELRHERVQPDTREDVLAAYVAAWLRKVERVGNMNYPEEARRRGITGAVRVEAVLRPDGTLARVEIVESSGEPILDAAAERIIRQGAPYSDFSPELRERIDRLHIPHRFVFARGSELRTDHSGD